MRCVFDKIKVKVKVILSNQRLKNPELDSQNSMVDFYSDHKKNISQLFLSRLLLKTFNEDGLNKYKRCWHGRRMGDQIRYLIPRLNIQIHNYLRLYFARFRP